MMNVKKEIILIGAVIVSLLLISSTTIVPQVHSQSVINKVEDENKDPYGFLEELTNYVDFEADKDNVKKLITKINAFLTKNSLTVDNYKESSFYKCADFQAFLNKDGGLVNNLELLAQEAWDTWTFYYQMSLDTAKAAVVDKVNSFFEDVFSGEEYTNLIATFEGDSRSLAEELGKVYNAKSKTVQVQENSNEPVLIPSGFVLEQALIAICTVIFLINWVVFGSVLGEATQLIVASILWVLLLIPAVIVLASDVVVGNAAAAFEALLVTIITLGDIFAEIFRQFAWSGGIFGIVVYAIGFYVNLYLLPIEFFVVFIVLFFEYAEYELGYIVSHLGPLINDIIMAAAENARDIYESIFGSTSDNLSSTSKRFACFLDRIGKMFPNLKLLLSKCVTN